LNIWKDVPSGDNPPRLLNVILEVTTGSRDKYEYDLKLEMFVLNRIIPSSVVFPVEYGFVPQTLSIDEDPLDIMVMSYEPLQVGCLVKARVIGALVTEDENGEDPKILSVPVNDFRFDDYQDIWQIHPNKLREIQEFFETYKRLEPTKFVKIKEWLNYEKTKVIVTTAMDRFKQLVSTKPTE
jgi:inorganic pyrophosphatase